MSASEATRFINDLHANTSLMQQVNTASTPIATVASSNGYDATTDEISAALRQYWQNNPNSQYHPLSEAPGF